MLLTAFDLDGAVLLVERVVVEVHHAGERRREAHAVRDGAVAVQPHHLVLLGHVVQEAEQSFKLCIIKLSCGYKDKLSLS